MEIIWQTIAAFIAIVGFGLLLEVPQKHIIHAGIAGAVCWLSYLTVLEMGYSLTSGGFLVQHLCGPFKPQLCQNVQSSCDCFSGIGNSAHGAGCFYLQKRLLSDSGSLLSFKRLFYGDAADFRRYGHGYFYCGFHIPLDAEALEGQEGIKI